MRPLQVLRVKSLRMTPEELDAYRAREAAREGSNVDNQRPPLKLTKPEIPEAAVLDVVLKALRLHRKVAWCNRMNTGALKDATGRPVHFGFVGLSDVIGQTVSGRFLAVEVKRAGKFPTPDQVAFLERVQRHGGVAFVARGVVDVMREMEAA